MIIYIPNGDIFTSECQVITNPVNCQGIMGKGLALKFKVCFGYAYIARYQNACASGSLVIGQPYLHTETDPWVLDFPTKDRYYRPAQLKWIRAGLHTLARKYDLWLIHSIALPKLGCGLGGLDWPLVRESIEEILGDLPIKIEVYS